MKLVTEDGTIEVTLKEALKLAEEQDLDLVQLNNDTDVAVCKIISYSKFLYSKEKKARKSNSKSKTSTLKEIKINWGIGQHDLEIKAKNIERIVIKDKDKVRVTILFKGRNAMIIDKGYEVVEKLKGLLAEGIITTEPKKVGNNLVFDVEYRRK